MAGFLIERGPDAVLTAPLFTNPDFDAVLTDEPLQTATTVVDEQLNASWVSEVDAILVGHSHYDHLMDTPYVANTKAKAARIYGSRTMTHLIANVLDDPARRVSLSSKVDYRMCPGLDTCGNDNHGQAGDWEWVVGGTASPRALRVRALCSKHSPQFAGLPVLWPGCADADKPPPRKASEWMLGDTFAYLIDFMEGGKVVFRVYFQDSATDPTRGYVAPDLIQERPVDLALLCAGAFNEVGNNPAGILENTQAKRVLMGHWDDFFRPLTQPLVSLRAHDLAILVKRLEAATGTKPWEGRYWFPAPGQVFVFQP